MMQVFDQALAGGGAKSINFQELAADLAQITFDYPFRIPPCERSHLLAFPISTQWSFLFEVHCNSQPFETPLSFSY